MTQRTFSLITATLFSLITLLHALRLLRGWQVTIGDIVVPTWVSWIGLAIAGYLAYQGFGRSIICGHGATIRPSKWASQTRKSELGTATSASSGSRY
jgi:hypothetical protein